MLVGYISRHILLHINFVHMLFTAAAIMSAVSHLSRGQNYTNVRLNVFKSSAKKVVLTSFEEHNVGLMAYQCMAWAAYIGGCGVWTQTGVLNRKCEINTFGPQVTQKGNTAVILYSM
jgi:hypothetical protein